MHDFSFLSRRPRLALAALSLAALPSARATAITCPAAMIETPVVSSLLKGWDVEVRAGRRTLAGTAIEVSRGSERRMLPPDATGVSGRQAYAAWSIAPADGEVYWVACSYGNTSALLLQRVPDTARRCVASAEVAGGQRLNVQPVQCD